MERDVSGTDKVHHEIGNLKAGTRQEHASGMWLSSPKVLFNTSHKIYTIGAWKLFFFLKDVPYIERTQAGHVTISISTRMTFER